MALSELYKNLKTRDEKLSFFLTLSCNLGNNHLGNLSSDRKPLYSYVISALAQEEGGIGLLVDMRADLLVRGLDVCHMTVQ